MNMTATDDIVTEVELFRDVFGCDTDDCEWHDETRRRGRIEVCAGEWRREPDGRWRFFADPDFDVMGDQGSPADQAAPPEAADAQRRTAAARQS